MIALFSVLLLASGAPMEVSTNATPQELVASARSMLPREAELSGRIILRNRRGIVQSEHEYTLVRKAGKTELSVDGKPYAADAPGNEPAAILGTDVTWSDLALEYLQWNDVAFDAEREGETVNGQTCAVILLRKGDRTVRAWVDRKTGALMQAEELEKGEAKRRLWGTRIKKFGDRWMANVLEVETLGSGHRTKITVENLK